MPSGAVLVDATTFWPERASTLTLGNPFSFGSMTPVLPPPPGVKSTHTVPVMAFWAAVEGLAVCAVSGMSRGGMATRPNLAVAPGEYGFSLT